MNGFSAILKRAISGSVRHEGRPPPLIVATRTDGLGGRLLAMANAKALADRLGYRFGFTWNSRKITDQESHTVDLVQNIFCAEFIDRHWLGEKVRAADFDLVGHAPFTSSDLDGIARQGRRRGWICNEFNALDFFRDDGAGPPRRSEALRAFGYAPAVRRALDAAGTCRLPGPMAALHLRSGDIVHGTARRRLVFADKVIPSTLAKAIVSELSSKGLTTLLVGQDRAVLDYLQAETGALRTDDFGAGDFEDEALSAFFEMALMARCQEIHAGKSIYAVVASVMGDVPCVGPGAVFGNQRAANFVLEELRANEADYHPREAAFGYQWAFLTREGEVSPARAREILKKAQVLDPENDAYDLKVAAAYFREADYPAGETILKSRLVSQARLRWKIPLPMMDIMTNPAGGWLAMEKDFEVFFAAAKAGYPYAMACSAYVLLEALGDQTSALEMAERLVKIEPGNPIFRRIRRRVEMGRKPRSGPWAKARWRLGRLRWP
jgi:tetratricopeptide (TPR) repeat protein